MTDIFDVVARAMFPEDYVLMDACPGGIECSLCKGMKKDHAPKVKRVLLAVLDHYSETVNVTNCMVNAGEQERGVEAIVAAAMTSEAGRVRIR